jgi:hypothetical protein
MSVNAWRQWLNRARYALADGTRREKSGLRRVPVRLRLEELESRLTPSVTFLTTPSNGTAGQVLNPPVQVQVRVNNFAIPKDPVTLTVFSGPGSFTLASTTTVLTGPTGVALFTNLVLNTAGDYTLQATDNGEGGGPSSPSSVVAIDPAPASQLVVSASAAQTPEGTPVSFTVTAADPFGNPATGSTIHFSSSTTEASLPPDYTFQASDNGEATFDVAFTVPGTQTVTATVLGSNVSAADSVSVEPVPIDNIQLNLSAADITIDQPITLTGTFTDPGTRDANTVVIAWGDGSDNTTLVLPAQVRSFSADHSYTTEGDYLPTVFITNTDGGSGVADSEEQALPGPIDEVADSHGQPGQTIVSTVTDAETDSISAALSISESDVGGAGILVARLADAALPTTTDRTGIRGIFDVRETGVGTIDSALVSFRFLVGPDFGQTPVLQFLDPATGTLRPFLPSGEHGSFTLTRQGNFIVGSVLLDNASTPTLRQLIRTVFTVSVNVPGAAATTAVSAALASADAAATAPVTTATFRTTSQLTLTLEPTQASQVSSGLSSFNATNSGGGGDPTPEDAAAALVSFLMDETGDGARAVWPFGVDGTLRAWIRQAGHTLPHATPAPPAESGSASPGSPTAQKEDESLRDASEFLFRELASTLTLPFTEATMSAQSPAEVRRAACHASAPQSVVSTTKTGSAAWLAGLAVAIPERRKNRERTKKIV